MGMSVKLGTLTLTTEMTLASRMPAQEQSSGHIEQANRGKVLAFEQPGHACTAGNTPTE
jgi:hypothetical protein